MPAAITLGGNSTDMKASTTALVYDGFNFGKFVKRFPHLRGHVTDLLIGDLFNDRLDEIIEPLEILRAEQEAASS